MRKNKFNGAYKVAMAVALSMSVFAAGCSDDDDPVTPPDSFAPPSNLVFANANGNISFTWDASPDESFTEFAGYNVYMSETSMVGLSDGDLAPLVVNASVDRSTMRTISNLTNGELMYFTVRSVHDNGDISDEGPQVRTAPVNTGIMRIFEFAAPPGQDSAADLSAGNTLGMNFANVASIDFYLGSEEDGDPQTATLTVKSPDLVVSSDTGWGSSLFKVLTNPDASTTTPSGFSNSVVLGTEESEIEGTAIAIELPDGRFGKITINSADLDTPGMRSIAFDFTYQPAKTTTPLF